MGILHDNSWVDWEKRRRYFCQLSWNMCICWSEEEEEHSMDHDLTSVVHVMPIWNVAPRHHHHHDNVFVIFCRQQLHFADDALRNNSCLVIKKYKLLDFENWDSAYVCIVTFFWQFRNGIVGPSSGKFHILSAGYLRWEFIKEKQENTLST